MSLRTDAKYGYGLKFTRLMPLNDDLSIPTPDRIIGGAGPFDFSGATAIAAVPITFKLDNGAEETITVDLSGAVSSSAVTVAELFAAINTAAPTDITASAEAVTGRLKIVYSGTENPEYLQVYGECALIAGIGQGRGCKFVKTDTLKSLSETPTQKDPETIGTVDANGLDTEIVTDGYRKGFTANMVDTAEDFELRALIEGGTYTPYDAGPPIVEENYDAPTSETSKVYFYIEAYYAVYERGSQKEGDLVGYRRAFHRSCKGAVGDKTRERAFSDNTYTIQGTSYVNESGVLLADTSYKEISVETYEALELAEV